MQTIRTIRPKNLNGKNIFQLRKWSRRAAQRGVIADKRFARSAGVKTQQFYAGISSDCDQVAGEIRIELVNRNVGNIATKCSLPKKQQRKLGLPPKIATA